MLQKIQYWQFQLDQSDIEGVMVWSQLAVPGEAPRLLQVLTMVLLLVFLMDINRIFVRD